MFNNMYNPMMGNANTPFNNMMNMMNQFNQFRQNFQGNPQQQVQELLNSGRMSQQDYNSLISLAQQFQGMMGK